MIKYRRARTHSQSSWKAEPCRPNADGEYDNDQKFMRTHKRLKETPPPLASDPFCMVLWPRADRCQGTIKRSIADNEPYFMTDIFPLIKKELTTSGVPFTASQVKYVGAYLKRILWWKELGKLMQIADITAQTKSMIDDLKAVCANYGLEIPVMNIKSLPRHSYTNSSTTNLSMRLVVVLNMRKQPEMKLTCLPCQRMVWADAGLGGSTRS